MALVEASLADEVPCEEPPCPGGERHIAFVLTSADGRAWERVPVASVFVGDGWSSMRYVTAWGPRFVAVGEYDNRQAIWISR